MNEWSTYFLKPLKGKVFLRVFGNSRYDMMRNKKSSKSSPIKIFAI